MLAEQIRQAGQLGPVLVGVSIVAMGVILERCWFWHRRGKPISQTVRNAWLEAFRSGQRPDHLSPVSPEGRALAFVFERREEKDEKLLDVALSREVRETNRFLTVLETCIAIAPMLGILGTVVGIIQAFAGMKGDAPDTAVMVSGISTAMLTTAMGLMIAVPGTVVYNLLAARAHKRQLETAELLQEAWVVMGEGQKSGVSGQASEN
jgi:biopolymer transport protein ExbB